MSASELNLRRHNLLPKPYPGLSQLPECQIVAAVMFVNNILYIIFSFHDNDRMCSKICEMTKIL